MQERRKHYRLISCHVLWREFSLISASLPHVVHPCYLRAGLHDTPEILRREVQRLIDEADDGSYDAILLGYGLCGNGTRGVGSSRTPLVMMRGHDCIAFLLGSKERHRETSGSIPGIYWYSPGWIDNDKVPGREQDDRMRGELSRRHPPERVERMIEVYRQSIKNYTHAVLVDQGLVDMGYYEEYSRRNAEYCGLRYGKVEGDPGLMRDFLAGRWDGDRFLVLRPGESVEASMDESVVRAAPAEGL